ncbi:MAG: hypothetical protein KBC11_01965 [Candidatus Pacebacteria bacterium]|nr:hypothetical protein [Candidatus Paceibacterota bacterium]
MKNKLGILLIKESFLQFLKEIYSFPPYLFLVSSVAFSILGILKVIDSDLAFYLFILSAISMALSTAILGLMEEKRNK